MRKKIISFSIWGNKSLYLDGAIANAQMQPDFYPGWKCRFYYDDTVPVSVISDLKKYDVELIHMGETVDCLGLYWRFRPMFDDKNIERFIVRDTDSKFTIRETTAVNEWIESGLPFHIMRDNESHGVPILGGTWGAVPDAVGNFEHKIIAWLSQLTPSYQNPRGLFHGTDQIFLGYYVWPIIKDNHLCHIREGCEKIRFHKNDRYFSVPLEQVGGHYVGQVA